MNDPPITTDAQLFNDSVSVLFINKNKLNNPLYLLKDIDFAKRYDVSRHTIYSIRKQLNIPSRTDRLLHKLKHTKTNRFTIKELSKIFNVKYQCLYKLINERNLPIKTDTPPISYMVAYQRTRKFTRLKRKKN